MRNDQNNWQPTQQELFQAVVDIRIKLFEQLVQHDIRFDHIRNGFFRVIENTNDLMFFVCSNVEPFLNDAITSLIRQQVSIDYVAQCARIDRNNIDKYIAYKTKIYNSIQMMSIVATTHTFAKDSNVSNWGIRGIPKHLSGEFRYHPW